MLPFRTPVTALASAAFSWGLATGLAAQDTLPVAPERTGPVALPAYTETTLANGLRLVVVPDDSAGATTYTLLVPGGSAADPAGLAGTASAVAAAMRCERALGRDDAAQRILYSVPEGRVRTRSERLADRDPRERGFRGDFTIDGEWEGGDLDLSIITGAGTRLSWMGGRTTLVGDRVDGSGRERLGLRWTGPGLYRIEISRTDPDDTSEIRGRLRVRVLGERQTIPFTLTSERQTVARVRVRRESRLVPVTGTVRP